MTSHAYDSAPPARRGLGGALDAYSVSVLGLVALLPAAGRMLPLSPRQLAGPSPRRGRAA